MPKGSVAAERALRKCERALMRLDGVEGVALSGVDGALEIAVLVSRLTRQLRAQIPAQIDGVRVRIEKTGSFSAQGGS